MNVLVDRLRDPGTLRSLVWVCMGLIGLPQTDTLADTAAGVLAIGLGIVSAAMKPKAAVIVDNVVTLK